MACLLLSPWPRAVPTADWLVRPQSLSRKAGDRLDLDQESGDGELRHFDERARRPGVPEELRANRIDLRAVLDVLQIHRDLEDVGEAPALGLEGSLQVAEHLPGLSDDIALTDYALLCVHRHHSGDEQQIAKPNRVGVMADRLAQIWQTNLFSLPIDHGFRIDPYGVGVAGLVANAAAAKGRTGAGAPGACAVEVSRQRNFQRDRKVALDRRVQIVPLRRLLVGVANPAKERLLQVLAHELEAQWQTAAAESARYRERGVYR